jgi:methionine synthase II (cobalamin-independent)
VNITDKKLDELVLATEEVGSVPLQDDFEEGRTNIDRSINDKVQVGLDYPCYPQLVGTPTKPMNMALQFLKPLAVTNPQIQIKGEEIALLSDEIVEPSGVIGTERAEYFLAFLKRNSLLDKLKGTRACVTGPFTLASYIGMKNIMTCGASKPHVIETLGRILTKSCRHLSNLGYNIVSIDEPFLSVILGANRLLYSYDQEFVVRVLNMMIREISSVSSIHVCGRITPLVKSTLLTSDVDIVDHEFTQSPKNHEVYSKQELESAGKMLAYGCVSSVSQRIETVQEIANALQNALKLFGPRILAKPDCGFGGLNGLPDAYSITLTKLRNMVQATRDVRKPYIGNP